MKTEIKDEYLGGERENTLSHETIATEIATICSRESNDPSTQVGACILDSDGRIISTGFNHNPNEWDSNIFPWRNDIKNIGEENTKYPYVIHAEMDAVSKCIDKSKLKGSTIYVTLFPCVQCAKLIVSFGIKKVVYSEIRESMDTICSIRLLEKCGVEIEAASKIVENDIEFNNKELEKFFSKFDLEGLEVFDSILYFSSFSGDMKDLVTNLKDIKTKVIDNNNYRTERLELIQSIESLNTKELKLFYELLDEAFLAASSDRRYLEHTLYFSDLKDMLDCRMEQKQLKKNK